MSDAAVFSGVQAYVLTARDVFCGTVASLLGVHGTVVDDVVVWQGPPYMGRNRSAICARFLQSSFETLVMVDADMEFDAAALATLIDASVTTGGVVGGLYVSARRGGGELFLEAWRQGDDGRLVALDTPPAGLDAVDAVGAGLIVIPRRVLEVVPAPWFPDRADEDLRFCVAARAERVPVFVHGGVLVAHARTLPFYPGGDR